MGLSFDGLTVVGAGKHRDSGSDVSEGWIAFLGRTGAPKDIDSDGVADDRDLCPFTILDVVVDPTGCPPFIPGDLDHDGDVDLKDYAILQRCMSGADEAGDPACNSSP